LKNDIRIRSESCFG